MDCPLLPSVSRPGWALPTLLLLCVALIAVPEEARAQISLPTEGTTVTRSFNSFDGSGFAPMPSEGQLDSEEFIVTGLNDRDLSFGDVATSGDFARGTSEGGESTGGIYAFEPSTGDFSLGVQPTSSDFTPGSFVAQYRNDTDGTVTAVDLAYEIEVFNDADRSNSFNTAYATGTCGSKPSTGDFSDLTSLDYTTPKAADTSPSWDPTTQSTTTSVNLPVGMCLFLQFTSDDVDGSGSRDEIALDELSVTPQQAPTVQFTAANGTVSEAEGSTTLTAEITNPDGNEVDVNVTFDTGSSASQGDFTSSFPGSATTETLTFPAGASTGDTETITLDLNENDGTEGEEVASFTLQNLSTSGDATIGPPSSFDLTIQDAVSEHEGDVLITELMPAPSVNDTYGEYIELYNATESAINLNGWIVDPPGIGDTNIGEDLHIPGRGFVVLCSSTDVSQNGGVGSCDYVQTGGLTNSGGSVFVRDESNAIVDSVKYDNAAPWPDFDGAALVFTGTSENNDGNNWTTASRRERGFTQDGSGSGDAGSPGRNGTGQTLQPTAEITGGAGWRMLAAPIGGVNADTLAKVSLVQGIEGHFPSAAPNLYKWPGGANADWMVPSSPTADLTGDGRGFIWYAFGTADTPRTDTPPFTLGLPGTPRTTDVTTAPLGEGFHLLGNPYAQSFDLSALDLSTQNFQTTVQVWDPSAESYVPVTQSGTSEDVIGAYQGFFVECTASTSCSGNALTFSSDGRRADPITPQGTADEPPRIGFQLVGRDEADSVRTRDKALTLHAPAGATAGWDVHDASKLTPLSDRYATAAFQQRVDGEPRLQAVASIPHTLSSDGIELPLSIQRQGVETIDTFQLHWPTWEHVPDRWTLTLHDTVADSTVDLRIDTAYVFSPSSPTMRSDAAPPSPLSLSSPQAQAASDSARFTLTVQPNPIPVELAHVAASVSDQAAQLSWTTASETDNAGFHVEHRGPDAKQFESLGFVDGHGTTDAPQHYRFRTDPLTPGRHVFRLRQVDLDGSTTQSDTVSVQIRLTGDAQVTVAPNPVQTAGTVTVQVPTEQRVEVTLYDMLGRRIRTLYDERLSAQQSHALPLRTEGLSSGSYLLRAKGEHFHTTRRVTVVR